MKARGWWVVMLVMALLVVVPRVWGQQPPETHPVSTHQDVVMSWDRSAMPGDVVLWAPRTVIAYQPASPFPYATSHLVCTSEFDAAKGRCPVVGDGAGGGAEGAVWLELIEARSGMRAEIMLLGSGQRPVSGNSCWSDFWTGGTFPLWSSVLETCGRHQSAGLGAALRVPVEQLSRLVAGVWKGTLALRLRLDSAGPDVADYTFDLSFEITDHNAVSIYFPQYESASPLVNLDARFDPISQTVGGRVTMDMCLYDGLGSQAAYLGVTARDNGTRTPGPTGFSLWHPAAGTDDSQRLDYTVTIEHNGAPFSMTNGVEQQLTGIDSANLRPVVGVGTQYTGWFMPGSTTGRRLALSIPVRCCSMPLAIENGAPLCSIVTV